MLRYKIDVLSKLKENGYNTTIIRREKLLNESALQYIRQGKPIGPVPLDAICSLLQCQPGDILEWVPDITEQSSPERQTELDDCAEKLTLPWEE